MDYQQLYDEARIRVQARLTSNESNLELLTHHEVFLTTLNQLAFMTKTHFERITAGEPIGMDIYRLRDLHEIERIAIGEILKITGRGKGYAGTNGQSL